MSSAKLLIGGAAAALAARFRRRRRAQGEREDEIAAGQVDELREELRRELERLAGADIKASRSRRESTSPPG
jgi:hypothetical protein